MVKKHNDPDTQNEEWLMHAYQLLLVLSGSLTGAETRRIDIGILWLESVETPDECQFEITGHVMHFHPVVLAGMAYGHSGSPFVEYVTGFKIKFTATLLAELPFDTGIDFPDRRQVGNALQ